MRNEVGNFQSALFWEIRTALTYANLLNCVMVVLPGIILSALRDDDRRK